MFSRIELDELMAADIPVGASLYLPTHLKGRDVRQDPIRLKNLLDAAEKQLLEFGLRRPEAADMLAPAQDLIPHEEFWRHQDHGLGIFLAPGFSRIHKLPVEVAELVLVGHRFHVRPLLPLLASDGQFFVLALTARDARLYHGTKHRLAEMDVPLVPERAAETRGSAGQPATEPEIATRPQAGLPAGAMTPTVADEGVPLEIELTGYLSHLDRAVQEALAGQTAPVILAAEPGMEGQFRRISGIKNLLEESIPTHPDAMSTEALHEQGYALVRPLFESGLHQTVDHLNSLLGTGNAKGSTEPAEIVSGATNSRVDSLLIAEGASLWGRVTGDGEIAGLHAEAAAGDEDLSDYAAVKTLQQGGKVYQVPAQDLPPGAVMAAVFRW